MDKNKKNKKPLRLSSEGRLQLRKNLGPDQVKRPSGKKSKTIQIIFKKKSSNKHEGSFQRKPIFNKQQGNKFDKNKPFDRASKASLFPVLTKGDINKKIDAKKFDNKKTSQKKIRKTLSPEDKKASKIDINKFPSSETQFFP